MSLSKVDMGPRPVPILQCRRCQCYDGCDLVLVGVAMKNLQKYHPHELVTLEEMVNGKKPRCEPDQRTDEPNVPLPRPVTRATKRRNEEEMKWRDNAVTRFLDRRMEERNAKMKNDAKAERVCVGPNDGVVMEISVFKRTCIGKCEKESCGHCYARKKPKESMKAVRRMKKKLLRKRFVNVL